MSDTTSTGLAPGFGGFASTPAGQLQYLNRQHNPYAFLQQQPEISDTAPAAAQSLASGGLAGVSPQQEQSWAKFMRYHQMARYRQGGRVWQRLDDGGDATGNDDGGGGQASNDGSQAGDQANSGFNDGGFGPGIGQNADGGFGAGFGNALGSQADQAAAANNSVFDAPGLTIGQGMLGFNNENVDPVALGVTALGRGIASGVPGGGLAMSAAKSLGYDPTSAVTNALGGQALGHGASMGASIGSALGGIGGPLGSMAGAALGGYAGAHGEMGGGALGGAGSTAGTSGVATSTGPASNAADGFGVNIGMDAPSPGSSVGLGNPGGSVQNQDINSSVSNATDLTALIRKINAELQSSASTSSYAGGGSVSGGGASNHAFHAGSGLVHGTSDGRADALHTHVPQGSYVVPADVVSGLGQGNTLAGAKKLAGLIPRQAPALAGGGMVPVRLSAGEFHIHPAHVAALGGGNLKAGSDKLDQMVGHVRAASARQVASMPPPR